MKQILFILCVLCSVQAFAGKPQQEFSVYHTDAGLTYWKHFPIRWGTCGMTSEEEMRVWKIIDDFQKQTSLQFIYTGRDSACVYGDGKNTILKTQLGCAGMTQQVVNGGEIVEADISVNPDIFREKDTGVLKVVLYHEICHMLGLEHVGNPKSLMYPVSSNTHGNLIDAGTARGLETLFPIQVHPLPKVIAQNDVPFGKLFWYKEGGSLRCSGNIARNAAPRSWYAYLDFGPMTVMYTQKDTTWSMYAGTKVVLPLSIFRPYAGLGLGIFVASPSDDFSDQSDKATALVYGCAGVNLKLPGLVGFFAEARKEYAFWDGWKHKPVPRLMTFNVGICLNIQGGAF